MRVIGITGGICSGKSTVSDWLQSKGYVVLDTDRMAHELYARDEQVKEKISFLFGTLERQKIRAQAFDQPEKRKALESVLHPKIDNILQKELKKEKEKGTDPVFVIVPLLFEVGWEDRFDKVWTIATPVRDQFRRMDDRDLDRSTAKKILQSQFSDEDRAERSDCVFRNSKDKSYLFEQIEEALQNL